VLVLPTPLEDRVFLEVYLTLTGLDRCALTLSVLDTDPVYPALLSSSLNQ
jgi:hypothetical protein